MSDKLEKKRPRDDETVVNDTETKFTRQFAHVEVHH